MSAKKKAVKPQPLCAACSHPRSFHGNPKGECKALGCECPTWRITKPAVAARRLAVVR